MVIFSPAVLPTNVRGDRRIVSAILDAAERLALARAAAASVDPGIAAAAQDEFILAAQDLYELFGIAAYSPMTVRRLLGRRSQDFRAALDESAAFRR